MRGVEIGVVVREIVDWCCVVDKRDERLCCCCFRWGCQELLLIDCGMGVRPCAVGESRESEKRETVRRFDEREFG